MKPTGRRRFRKMNARFRQRGSAVVRERARSTSAGKARKLILNDFWGGDPLPLPRTVFSPRSLVGMTMGARKRKAKFDAWHKAVTYGREVITRALRRCIATDQTKLRVGNVAIEYAQQRRRYRIGERLRPCPGCLRCRSCAGCEVLTFEGDVCEDCGRETPMATTSCDGSGVIPARPRVNQGSEAR